MAFIDRLTLISGNDIPFPAARLSIHQPTLKEIAYMGENNFFTACNFLKFNKDILSDSDKINLENLSNFEIILSIIKQKDRRAIKTLRNFEMFLQLLFPTYLISIEKESIVLKKESNSEEQFSITKDNFDEFKDIVLIMEGIQKESETYNPGGSLSASIAAKLKAGRQKAAAAKSQTEGDDGSVIERYISILTVGVQKTYQELVQYTLYQLIDEFQRYELKTNYDIYIQAKMAGATGLKEVDNWMKDIHK